MDPSSPPASVQVLTNTDLLYGIFNFVPFASTDRDSHLVQCVTVCRTFHESATRVLWRRLDSLLPLWHLLAPSNTSFPTPHSSGSPLNDNELFSYLQNVLSAQLYPDSRQWDRFQWHAARVREIVHHDAAMQAVNFTNHLLIQTVFMQSGRNAVLPLLHSLQWHSPSRIANDIDALPLFFTSTLRSVTIDFDWANDDTLVSILRSLHKSSPSLEKIVLKAGPKLSASGGLSLVGALVCFVQLHTIHIPQVQGFDAFRILATKPNLKQLDIFRATGSWVGPHHAISLDNLCELSVTGDLSDLSGLFTHVHFQVLKCATITLGYSTASCIAMGDLPPFLALFYKAVSGSALERFDFVIHMVSHLLIPPVNQPPLRDLLAPILPIHTLRSFSMRAVDMLVSLRVHDSDIEAFADAWPEIECLSLFPSSLSHHPRLSFNVVHHLYRRCPNLRDLLIPPLSWPVIGVHNIPPPLDGSPRHPLRYFSTEYQFAVMTEKRPLPSRRTDEDAEAIARYLLDLFPNLDPQRYKCHLDEVDSTGGVWGWLRAGPREGTGPPLMGRWINVVRHIYAISSARDEV